MLEVERQKAKVSSLKEENYRYLSTKDEYLKSEKESCAKISKVTY